MPTAASVVQAFKGHDRLELHFGQGPPATFTLTNPGNAVAVRDATGKVVYLGYSSGQKSFPKRGRPPGGSRGANRPGPVGGRFRS